jgi:hypothetical protein
VYSVIAVGGDVGLGNVKKEIADEIVVSRRGNCIRQIGGCYLLRNRCCVAAFVLRTCGELSPRANTDLLTLP